MGAEFSDAPLSHIFRYTMPPGKKKSQDSHAAQASIPILSAAALLSLSQIVELRPSADSARAHRKEYVF